MNILKSNQNFSVGATRLRLTDSDQVYNISALPNREYKVTYQQWLEGDEASLRKAYSTRARCAVYSSAWQTFGVSLKNNVGLPLEDIPSNISSIPDDELFSAVTDAVRHPPCIRKAALKFVEEVFDGQAYAAVHWRYDDKDWGMHCRNGKNKDVCESLEKIKPFDVASGIVKVLARKIFQKNDSNSSTYLYIASPPSLNQFIDEVFDAIRNLTSRIVRAQKPVEEFLKRNYEKCWERHGWVYTDYIVSMVEMEIMYYSDWFFFSPISTWSTTVLPWRRTNISGKITRKFHASILELATKESELRTKSGNVS